MDGGRRGHGLGRSGQPPRLDVPARTPLILEDEEKMRTASPTPRRRIPPSPRLRLPPIALASPSCSTALCGARRARRRGDAHGHRGPGLHRFSPSLADDQHRRDTVEWVWAGGVHSSRRPASPASPMTGGTAAFSPTRSPTASRSWPPEPSLFLPAPLRVRNDGRDHRAGRRRRRRLPTSATATPTPTTAQPSCRPEPHRLPPLPATAAPVRPGCRSRPCPPPGSGTCSGAGAAATAPAPDPALPGLGKARNPKSEIRKQTEIRSPKSVRNRPTCLLSEWRLAVEPALKLTSAGDRSPPPIR